MPLKEQLALEDAGGAEYADVVRGGSLQVGQRCGIFDVKFRIELASSSARLITKGKGKWQRSVLKALTVSLSKLCREHWAGKLSSHSEKLSSAVDAEALSSLAFQ